MKLRAPALPLITVDPYFSIWSAADRLTDQMPCHWTGKLNSITGTAVIDGTSYRFLGTGEEPAMKQVSVEVEAMSTEVFMEAGNVRLRLFFLTPLLMDDYEHLTRPVSYLHVSADSLDGQEHEVSVKISASEELCLDCKGQMPVTTETSILPGNIHTAKMGSVKQEILAKSGDDIRIDWGYFYLSVQGEQAEVSVYQEDMAWVSAAADVSREGALFAFAYDDIESMVYFGDRLKSWWNRDGKTIETAICEAYGDYAEMEKSCAAFSYKLFRDAVKAGGEKYAELLLLAYRQVLAAHKLVLDKDGNLLYVSKECFSNGCAATADVSYPSIPMFLLYNPELVKGMMRPIFRYAEGGVWPFDFAPHDVGQYPLLNGQVYSEGTDPRWQMPVEECGNMLLMMSAVCVAQKDASFAAEHLETLKQWAKYLLENGADPDNQLCTDDFAGHLAHNCNLSIKAILGVAAYGLLLKRRGEEAQGEEWMEEARSMAKAWVEKAAEGDGTYRLAFDQPGTFSMKYNAVWDRLLGLRIFPESTWDKELESYLTRLNPYGMPLDNRAGYTKSDWLVWVASMMKDKKDFETMVSHLWDAYDNMPNRIPLGDWFETEDAWQAKHREFQNRTVQGGLFIQLLYGQGNFQR